MNKLLKKINNDRRLSISLTLLFLIIAYIIFSLALNSGSYWQYFGGLVCVIVVINLIKKAIIKR